MGRSTTQAGLRPQDAAELRSSESRLRTLLEMTSLMVWTTNGAGEVEADSPSWRAFTGQTLDQFRGRGWLEALHPDDRERARNAWLEALTETAVYAVEYRVRRGDGTYRETLARGTPVLDDHGNVAEWISSNVDVTEQRTAEREAARARQEAEAGRVLLGSVLREAPVAIAILRGPEHRFEFSNSRYNELVARDPSGKTVRQAFPELAGQGIYELLDQVYATGETFFGKEVPLRLVRQGVAADCYFNFNYQASRGEAGRVEGVLVVAVEVTDQVVARQQVELLAQERQRDRDLLARRAAQLALSAEVGAVLSSAEETGPMLQRCAEAINRHVGAAFTRIWALNAAERVLELKASAGLYTHLDGPHGRVPVGQFKIGRIAEKRKPHLSNDVPHDPEVGDPAWAVREGMVAFAGYPLLLDGQVVGVVALFARQPLLDEVLSSLGAVANTLATGLERKRGEEQRARLVEGERRARAEVELERGKLQEIFAQAPAAIAMLRGPEHLFEFANPRYREIVTRDPVGKTIQQAFPELAGQGIYELLDGVFRSGEPFIGNEVPLRLVRAGKEQDAFFNFTYQPTRGLNGRVDGILVVAVEVTDQVVARRQVEALARDLERSNRDLDQFAYVASHDLKAPLRGIANLSSWLEEDLAPVLTPPTREQLNLLRGRVMRMEGLIDGVLHYSRAGRVKQTPEQVDVGRLLAEVVELLAPPPEARIEIPAGLPTLLTERVTLQQVFMNLISNALKHARRGDVQVRVAHASSKVDDTFTVTDNGQGIAPEFHEKIWGIFQTLEARDDVESTGIGLSVVQKVVESRGGRVWVESSAGQGAAFHFTWPKTARTEKAP